VISLLKQIRYFIAVVDCNSFTEAAEQMYISQSAISQQIQSLEKELGVKLIIRENRKFTLTPAGEYFYRNSKGVVDALEKLTRETVRIGKDSEASLRIGYLRCYSGQELHEAVAQFSEIYPEVDITIINGTHEELYDMLRTGSVDLVLNDQRRAFSDEYVNFELLQCGCYIEISKRSSFGDKENVTLEDLEHTTCILISSKEQQNSEEEYYKNTLGFSGNFIFAENLEEGRLMAIGGRGFIPVESVGTLPQTQATLTRIPLIRDGRQIMRNYCVFWRKENSGYYIEEFAYTLKKLLKE
jgi:Transcriptional regulator